MTEARVARKFTDEYVDSSGGKEPAMMFHPYKREDKLIVLGVIYEDICASGKGYIVFDSERVHAFVVDSSLLQPLDDGIIPVVCAVDFN